MSPAERREKEERAAMANSVELWRKAAQEALAIADAWKALATARRDASEAEMPSEEYFAASEAEEAALRALEELGVDTEGA